MSLVSEDLEQLLRKPTAAMLEQRLSKALEAERAARERFYEEIQPGDKWEFINGQKVMHSPARSKHSMAVWFVSKIFSAYLDARPGGAIYLEKTLVEFTRNSYEPDICFYGPAKFSAITEDQWKFPPPDLVVEILSPSTEANDRGIKFDDYEAHGVLEYWIIDPDSQVLEQYVLEVGRYQQRFTGTTGQVACQAIPGLNFPAEAVFDDEARRSWARGLNPAS